MFSQGFLLTFFVCSIFNGGIIFGGENSTTLLLPSSEIDQRSELIQAGDRVVFLGDSNTYAGTWVDLIDAWYRKHQVGLGCEFLNLGLSSETVCGLTEPSHPFPRPDVRERLGRVLTRLKPDVMVVCYGMNDAIYHPFDSGRSEAFRAAIKKVCHQIRASGAKLILLTPPPFDPVPLAKAGRLVSASKPDAEFSWQFVADDYDKTMHRYADWIRQQSSLADAIIDVHAPLREALANARDIDPEASFSADGVHFGIEGHRVLATTVLQALGHKPNLTFDPQYFAAVTKRQRILRDAFLTHCGHTRPNVPAGLPMDQALAKAAEIEAKLKP